MLVAHHARLAREARWRLELDVGFKRLQNLHLEKLRRARLEDASGRLVVALHVEHLVHALVDVQFVLRVNAAKLESGVWRSRRAAQRWRAWSCASQRSSARANSCARARRGRWPSRAWLRCSSSCAAFRSCSRSCRRSAARLIATQLEEARVMLEGDARARRGRRGVGLGRRGTGIVSSR